jgi:hypothetical protein
LDARTQTAAMRASRRSLSARDARTILELRRIAQQAVVRMLQPPLLCRRGQADQGLPYKKEGAVRPQPPKCDNSPHVFDILRPDCNHCNDCIRLCVREFDDLIPVVTRTRFTNQESVQKRETIILGVCA